MGRKRRTIPWIGVRGEVYYVFWTDDETGKTKRLSLGTTESVEAQQRYAAFLARGYEIFNPKPGGLTVSQALDQYQREHVETSVISQSRSLCSIAHLKVFFNHTPLSEIDIPACRTYANARRQGEVSGNTKKQRHRPVSDSTIRRELVVLSAATRHALKWKRITADKVPSIETPREAQEETPWLTKSELRRAIDECRDPKLKAFIQTAYYTAGRRRSIETLRKEQIDLRHGRINLRAPDETVIQRKSKKRRPIVPLFPQIRPVVERLMIDSPTEWLFGEPKKMYDGFKSHMQLLGLGCKAFPHVLRHSRATHLLQDGVPIYDVARLLGDTIATVDRVYGHHSADHLAETVGGGARLTLGID
jgi:integrase